jgi:hypothetical protein
LHKAREIPKKNLSGEVEKELTGRETEGGDSFLRTASRGGGIRGRANLGRALSSDRDMRGSADANRLDGIVKTNL